MSAFLKNTTTHDITLNIGEASVTVPAGAMSPVGFAPGIAKIDGATLKDGLKTPAIKGYFDDGKLVVDGKEPASPATSAGGKGDDENEDDTPEYLQGNVSQVTANIKALTDDVLATAADAEVAGQNRKGVLEAIEYEIKTRADAKANAQ